MKLSYYFGDMSETFLSFLPEMGTAAGSAVAWLTNFKEGKGVGALLGYSVGKGTQQLIKFCFPVFQSNRTNYTCLAVAAYSVCAIDTTLRITSLVGTSHESTANLLVDQGLFYSTLTAGLASALKAAPMIQAMGEKCYDKIHSFFLPAKHTPTKMNHKSKRFRRR